MNRTNGRMALGIIFVLTGCEVTEQAQPQVTEPAKEGLTASCVKARERAASCRNEIVDEWIAVRAKYNPDIAEMMATDAEKAKIRTVALDEFKKDGSGPLEPRVEACAALAEHLPDSMLPVIRGFEACTSRSTCDEYRECVIPAFEQIEIARTQHTK